jgi:hypothetical protein
MDRFYRQELGERQMGFENDSSVKMNQGDRQGGHIQKLQEDARSGADSSDRNGQPAHGFEGKVNPPEGVSNDLQDGAAEIIRGDFAKVLKSSTSNAEKVLPKVRIED